MHGLMRGAGINPCLYSTVLFGSKITSDSSEALVTTKKRQDVASTIQLPPSSGNKFLDIIGKGFFAAHNEVKFIWML